MPAAYRDFLIRFGDGGAGPGNGMLPLKEAEQTLHERGKTWRPLVASLARPFPAPSTLDESRELPYPADGILPVADIGCGMMYLLVVTGDERGCMWCLSDIGSYHPVTHAEYPRLSASATWQERQRANDAFEKSLLGPRRRDRVKFWPWYEEWLASCLQKIKGDACRFRDTKS